MGRSLENQRTTLKPASERVFDFLISVCSSFFTVSESKNNDAGSFKTDGFHLRTEKEPAVSCFSHISRTVVMKPKIRLITSGSVPVSATGVKKNREPPF